MILKHLIHTRYNEQFYCSWSDGSLMGPSLLKQGFPWHVKPTRHHYIAAIAVQFHRRHVNGRTSFARFSQAQRVVLTVACIVQLQAHNQYIPPRYLTGSYRQCR